MRGERLTGPVAPKWLERGTWLSKAIDEIDAGNMANVHDLRAKLAAKFEALSDGLSAEAFLVLSDRWGEARGTDLVERLVEPQRGIWKRFCNTRQFLNGAILARLRFGTLIAYGRPNAPDGPWTWIPPDAWMNLRVDTAQQDLVRGENTAYWRVRVVDPATYPADPPLEKAEATPAPRPRPKGAIDYRAADLPLVEKMHQLISAGRANDPWNAALQVCGEAVGFGRPASKAKRLSKLYCERRSAVSNAENG